jgi:hypothetical protein
MKNSYGSCKTIQTHLFHGTGHTASLFRQEEYLAALDGFITVGS